MVDLAAFLSVSVPGTTLIQFLIKFCNCPEKFDLGSLYWREYSPHVVQGYQMPEGCLRYYAESEKQSFENIKLKSQLKIQSELHEFPYLWVTC